MSTQLRTLTLKCPGCGAGLDVTPEMDRFACGYCGTEQIVQRQGGTVALKLITDAILQVQSGTDRTAAELAIRRINDEVAALDFEVKNIPIPRGHIGPKALIICGVACLIPCLMGLPSALRSGADFGAVLFGILFLPSVFFVCALISHRESKLISKRLKRLEELTQQRRSLLTKLAQQKAIVDK